VLVVMVLGWFFLKPVITTRFLSTTGATFSLTQRIEFIGTAWRMGLAKPWTGWGLGTYQLVMPRFTQQSDEQPRYAHNTYAQLLGETGWPLALLWAVMVMFIGWQGWRQWQRKTDEGTKRWRLALFFGWLTLTIEAGLDFGWYFPAVGIPWWLISGSFLFRSGPVLAPSGIKKLGYVVAGLLVIWIGSRAAIADLRLLQAHTAGSRQQTTLYLERLSAAVNTFPFRAAAVEQIGALINENTTESRQSTTDLLARVIPSNQGDYAYFNFLAKLNEVAGDKGAALAAYAKTYELDPRFHHDLVLAYVQLLISEGRRDEGIKIGTEYLTRVGEATKNPLFTESLNRLRDLVQTQ